MKLLPQISNYDYNEVHPYNQYTQCAQLTEYAQCVNDYIYDLLKRFIDQFGRYLNIYNKTSSDYTSFYLKNYYGLSSIPNPSTSRALAKNLYDDNREFDADEDVLYDDLLSDDDLNALNLNPEFFIAVSRFRLNYAYPVFNLEAISFLLKEWYKASERKNLDLRTLKFEFTENGLKITCPDFLCWDQLRLIVRYSPDLLGLPYGNSIEINVLREENTDEMV